MHDLLILGAGAALGTSLCTLAGAFNLLLGITPAARERLEQRQALHDIVELLGELKATVDRTHMSQAVEPEPAAEPRLILVAAADA